MLKLAMSILEPKEITGKRIKELRKSEGVKQTTLAQAVGITAAFLSGIENGKKGISTEVLQKIAEYFNTSTDYLLGRSNLREPLITIAAHSDDPEGIPPEAQEEIFQYIEFIKQKYGIGKKKDK